MLVFVIVEAMMFAGLVSAFMLTRAADGGAWPLAGQARLPLAQTAVNTAALLASGALVFQAARAREKWGARVGPSLLAAIALGAFFAFSQGMEWVGLARQGLSQTSSQHGSFFGLIVGMYGAHVLGALILLGSAWRGERRGSLTHSAFSAARTAWYFVVGVWPVLYLCLY
jgi:heme/copper-type cytochrome/quinol oxidase subunit 3